MTHLSRGRYKSTLSCFQFSHVGEKPPKPQTKPRGKTSKSLVLPVNKSESTDMNHYSEFKLITETTIRALSTGPLPFR